MGGGSPESIIREGQTLHIYDAGTAAGTDRGIGVVQDVDWDTGTVGAVAAVVGTGSPTTTYAMGTDLRTESGLGTLQLVTPFVVRVKSLPPFCGGCVNQWFYAGTASAELHFVPEPSATVLLAVGLGGLAVLSRWSRRREP